MTRTVFVFSNALDGLDLLEKLPRVYVRLTGTYSLLNPLPFRIINSRSSPIMKDDLTLLHISHINRSQSFMQRERRRIEYVSHSGRRSCLMDHCKHCKFAVRRWPFFSLYLQRELNLRRARMMAAPGLLMQERRRRCMSKIELTLSSVYSRQRHVG